MARKKSKPTSPPAEARNGLMQRQILGAAARLFFTKGFAQTSLQDVAEAIGTSRPALYYYFRNKEELLSALLEDVTFAAAENARAIEEVRALPPDKRLKEAVRSHVVWILTRRTEFQLLDRSDNDLPAALRKRHDAAKREVLESFTAIIRDGIAGGAFRVVDERVAAFAVIGMSNWASRWFRDEGRKSIDEVAEAIADFALHALAQPGRRRAVKGGPKAVLQSLRDDLERLERLI